MRYNKVNYDIMMIKKNRQVQKVIQGSDTFFRYNF